VPSDLLCKDKLGLLQPGDVTRLTVLVLANAICSKGSRARRFEREYAKDAPFTINEKQEVAVPMIYQLRRFPFATGARTAATPARAGTGRHARGWA
jgi:serine protease inhibitor